jgi:gluconokinase
MIDDLLPAIVVMGVAGVGKTSVGERLAVRLGVPLLEGDDFHPRRNVEKMSLGVALNDADRWPWLDAIGAAIKNAPANSLVVTCSALKRAYRERLVAAAGRPLVFLFLDASRETLAARLAARRGHFMPPGLLDSQLATLERPTPNETPIRISVEPPLDAVVDDALAGLAGVIRPR